MDPSGDKNPLHPNQPKRQIIKKRKIHDISTGQSHPGGGKPMETEEGSSYIDCSSSDESTYAPIKTQNRFSCLKNEEIPLRDNTANSKPPPIVLDGLVKNHRNTIEKVKTILQNSKFQIKYGMNKTNILTENLENYTKLKEYFVRSKQPFHTYTAKGEKTHAFVLRGLNEQTMPEDIKMDLLEQKIHIKNVYKMKGTRTPLFLIITDNQVTLKFLQKTVRIVDFTVISWERQYQTKRMVQCRKC